MNMLKIFVGIIVVFTGVFTLLANETPPPKKSAKELAGMIAPFVDEDTVFVGYLDLTKISGLPRLLGLLEKIGNIDGMPPKAAENMDIIIKAVENIDDLDHFRVFYEQRIEPLLEADITDFFFLFNTKDTHFGVYVVVPNIDTEKKAAALEIAFNGKESASTAFWAVRSGNNVVIGGSGLSLWSGGYASTAPPLLSFITYEYLFLNNEEKKKTLLKRFMNFRAKRNPLLVEAFEAVDHCDVFNVAVLFPDSFTAMELSILKTMEAPMNEYSFSFLKERRRYAALGIDSRKPAAIFTTKSTSPEKAEEYAGFIDIVWRKIIANYLRLPYMYAGSEENFRNFNGLTYAQMYELCVALLPKADGSDVRTVVDAAFIETEGSKILKTMLESKTAPATGILKDRPFSPDGLFTNPTFYLNENL